MEQAAVQSGPHRRITNRPQGLSPPHTVTGKANGSDGEQCQGAWFGHRSFTHYAHPRNVGAVITGVVVVNDVSR